MTISNCSECQFFDRKPNHPGDIVCGVFPAYASMWQRLQSLDTYSLELIPVDHCRDFALNPLLEIKEIDLSLSFSQWQEFRRIASNTIVEQKLESCQINLNLPLSRQIWQQIADSSTNPHILEQLQNQGFEPTNPTHNDLEIWTEVDSSCISAIAYDSVNATLKIRFNSGYVYEYSNVPVNEFIHFRDAHSKGRFFNHHIKEHYSYAIAYFTRS